MTVKVDPRAGVKYLSVLSYGTPDTKNLSLGVYYLNFLVVAVVGGLFAKMLISSWKAWCHSHLQVWGSSYFGPKWRSNRRFPRVSEQAGFFFMVEFFVAYPRQRSGLKQRIYTVLVGLAAIILPVFPIMGVLVVSRHEYFGPMYTFNSFGAAMGMLQSLFGLVYLTAYYLGLQWSLRCGFQWKNPDFLLKNPEFLLNLLVYNKTGRSSGDRSSFSW